MISFRVDGRSGVPPYLQLVQQVRQALRMGVLDVGVAGHRPSVAVVAGSAERGADVGGATVGAVFVDDEVGEAVVLVDEHAAVPSGWVAVRFVEPRLVFEIAFQEIHPSTRHRSGVAVRFPRIARWREDKTPDQADHIEKLTELLSLEEAAQPIRPKPGPSGSCVRHRD